MQRLVAIAVMIGLLLAGQEFVTDYTEVFEGTPLAVMPEGHHGDDGHDPADHQPGCDNCHFGGVHLVGLVAQAVTMARSPAVMATRLDAALLPPVSPIPPDRPPIA